MTKYHDNADEIPSIGRILRPGSLKPKIITLQEMLRPGEIIIGYYDALVRKIAPVLETQEDINIFYQQYASGHFIKMGYYAIPKERLHVRFS